MLNGLDDEPTEQGEFGTLYRPNDYFIFKAQSFSPQYVVCMNDASLLIMALIRLAANVEKY